METHLPSNSPAEKATIHWRWHKNILTEIILELMQREHAFLPGLKLLLKKPFQYCVCSYAHRKHSQFFEPGEVDEIWITFPDPFPKKGDAKKRLSAKGFLDRYQKICKTGAVVHFKTDDLPLFHSTKESIDDFGLKTLYYKENIYASSLEFEELSIQTYYEKSHLANGRTINYLKFQL